MVRFGTPCDFDGICPYEANGWSSCEYWCGAEELPEDYYEDYHWNIAYQEWV